MEPLKIEPGVMRYQAMIGVGGIGAGTFFALSGNHTLGREESRGGRFLDRRDYCKLHIVSHYVKALLGFDFEVIPIGKMGDDEPGRRLYSEMEEAGLDMRRVTLCPEEQTLFSFCFVYPDGSGGNMTTDDSACSKIDASFVSEARPEFARFHGKGIALAVPEVPIEARTALLKLGTEHGFFRVASFTSREIAAAVDSGILRDVDLLAINADEAAAVLDTDAVDLLPTDLVEAAVEKLKEMNSRMLISITAGRRGSWCWDGRSISHAPVFQAEIKCTAGAGDAHLAGVISGLAAGLPLSEAQVLGALAGGLSVTSQHTINKDIDRHSLRSFAENSDLRITDGIARLLEE